MSSHRLNAWQPENNFRFSDINRPKPKVYNGRFLYHDPVHGRSSYSRYNFHQTTSQSIGLAPRKSLVPTGFSSRAPRKSWNFFFTRPSTFKVLLYQLSARTTHKWYDLLIVIFSIQITDYNWNINCIQYVNFSSRKAKEGCRDLCYK